jgi:hypothetical protein
MEENKKKSKKRKKGKIKRFTDFASEKTYLWNPISNTNSPAPGYSVSFKTTTESLDQNLNTVEIEEDIKDILIDLKDIGFNIKFQLAKYSREIGKSKNIHVLITHSIDNSHSDYFMYSEIETYIERLIDYMGRIGYSEEYDSESPFRRSKDKNKRFLLFCIVFKEL